MAHPTPALPPRQEAFCRHVARGETLAEAARAAGYAPLSARQRGSALWAEAAIQVRIAQHAADQARERDGILEEAALRLDEITSGSIAAGQYRTALRSIVVKLRMLGLE